MDTTTRNLPLPLPEAIPLFFFISMPRIGSIISSIYKSMMDLRSAERLASKISKYLDTRRETVRLIVGSIRREEETIGDIDILLVSPRYSEKTLREMEVRDNPFFSVVRWVSRGTRRASFIVEPSWEHIGIRAGGMVPRGIPPREMVPRVQIDVFYATQKELPFALLHCTGSKEYLMRMRYIASLRGYKLNQYGIYKKDTGDDMVPLSRRFRTEGDIQEYLGMKRRHPRERV